MKNDPTFKFLAAVILTGLVLACFNHVSLSSDHLLSPPLPGAGTFSFHQFKDAAKALIERTMSSHASVKS